MGRGGREWGGEGESVEGRGRVGRGGGDGKRKSGQQGG